MKCPVCGMVREKASLTCPRCGHDHSSELQQTSCSACGTPVPRQAKACLMWGANVGDPVRSPGVPRVPLPKIPWLPFPMPESARLTVLMAGIVAVLMLISMLWVGGSLLARSPQQGRVVVLTTPARFALPTATSTATPTRTPTNTTTVTPTPTETRVDIYHVVAVGENPGAIAARYGMSLEQLMEANSIEDPRRLRVGQALLVPPTWTPENATPNPDWTPTPTPFIYTVQAGDNLSSIAIWAGTSVEAIMKLNDLDSPRWLSVGQKLAVPASPNDKGTPTPTLDIKFAVHIVVRGDSLLGLAVDYGTSVESIVQANHIEDERFVRIGEPLVIPLGTSTPTPQPTPLPTNTPKPGPRYSAPVPLLPAQEKYFWGDTDPILLNWISVGVLDDDDWYLVELRRLQNGGETIHYGWTRSTSWRVPPSFFPEKSTRHHLFRWQVRVVQSLTTDADPAKLESKSPRSQMRTFYWY
jgi:LysM repeat protein/ribosomal protein L37E